MRFTPEQLIDELYGPPKKEGQKRLEDFKKKKVSKPERPKGTRESIITAETKEGKEIIFDFEQIKSYWENFYQEHNLAEIAQELENTEIILTPEQVQTIREKTREGFDRFYLFPSPELQSQYLKRIKEETEKEIPGLPDSHQYSKEGAWFSDTVKPNFPDKIQTLNRPQEKPYLLFIKDTQEVDDATRGKSAEELRQILKQKNQTGLTLPEYLIFQRDYAFNHQNEQKPHPETQYWTWLLDSELSPDSSGPGRVLVSDWTPGGRRVGVDSYSPSYRDSDRGARSSAIFEIL